MEQLIPRPENLFEKKPKLKDLDVKGREIFGLEPKLEKFSKLKEGEDFKIIFENKDLKTDHPLVEDFLFVNPESGDVRRLVEPPHWRASSFDGIRGVFQSGRLADYFYTSNTKGVGYLKPTLKGGRSLSSYDDWKRVDEYNRDNVYGMAGQKDFVDTNGDNLVDKSKSLIKEGLRTECYAVIAKLTHVYYKGDRVSVAELRKKGVIVSQKDYEPEIGIRYLKINNRVAEVKEASSKRARTLFVKAFDVFNKETQDKNLDFPVIQVGDKNSEEIYFREFFRRMGANLGIMQRSDLSLWHMHSSNITLAAEIVDIGPMASRGIEACFKDLRDAAYALKALMGAGKAQGLSVGKIEELAPIFLTAFEEKLSTRQQKWKRAAEKIIKAALVDGKRLVSLKHGEIEAWGLDL